MLAVLRLVCKYLFHVMQHVPWTVHYNARTDNYASRWLQTERGKWLLKRSDSFVINMRRSCGTAADYIVTMKKLLQHHKPQRLSLFVPCCAMAAVIALAAGQQNVSTFSLSSLQWLDIEIRPCTLRGADPHSCPTNLSTLLRACANTLDQLSVTVPLKTANSLLAFIPLPADFPSLTYLSVTMGDDLFLDTQDALARFIHQCVRAERPTSGA